MQTLDRLLQGIGIPHSAFLSVILGMMLFSFPIGMFTVFHSEIGSEINFELPLGELAGYDMWPVSELELGDAFLMIWSLYAVLFAIALLGPKAGFVKTVSPMASGGAARTGPNYMHAGITWFSILILVSAVIDAMQGQLGISIVAPQAENDLTQFLHASMSPLLEELGFRLILVGLPLCLLYGSRHSVVRLAKSLWHPSAHLDARDPRRALVIIVGTGILFGFAHIMTDESWSDGKLAQASAAGIILGWVYFRYGFVAALLVHWATNYFVFAYVNFLAQAGETSVHAAFSHSLVTTMEVLFLAAGVMSILVMLGRHICSRRADGLEV